MVFRFNIGKMSKDIIFKTDEYVFSYTTIVVSDFKVV